jgi:uncharacterized protein YcfJ
MTLSFFFRSSPNKETQKKSNYSFSDWLANLIPCRQRLISAMQCAVGGASVGAYFGSVIGNQFGKTKDNELDAEDAARTLVLAILITKAVARNMFDSCVTQGTTLLSLLQKDFQQRISNYLSVSYMATQLDCMFAGACAPLRCLIDARKNTSNEQEFQDALRTQNCFSPDNFLQDLHSIQAEAKSYPSFELGCNYSEPVDYLDPLNTIITKLDALGFNHNTQYCDYSIQLKHEPVAPSCQLTGALVGAALGAFAGGCFGLFMEPKQVEQTAPLQTSTNTSNTSMRRPNQ